MVFFELKSEGYRDGIKRKETRLGWHCTFGIAHCGILHTIEVDEVTAHNGITQVCNANK